eukprot:CAMPEP_0183298622 /NCGR_PEP_ID=MMETSP0160_2-20130417/5589_1 /TAXON_ID=2839 ORGANISM="Odontella Sinensis, Strain Grunow 1884" /NCGR_SAMPLE_ID=MMETSP0160_2 /ASSEMBLY_ACC=CAM_ASM_000250 /LENGTH=129 /DNA_ID=CAMNT_0025460699 /DNA_START=62 /DNA_END=447 /DNA_ORIENTATION=+
MRLLPKIFSPLLVAISVLCVFSSAASQRRLGQPHPENNNTTVQNDARYLKHKNNFMLKLYWKKGYMWQGDKREKKWCAEDSGKNIKIQTCNHKTSKQKWTRNGSTIRTKDGKLCWTKGSDYITLKKCNG